MSFPLPVIAARDLQPPAPDQQWLIRDLWGRRAVGLIAAAPKRGKTWLGLDFALSIASATPCLDHFAVEDPGRALVYLAEDPLPAVRQRLDALCHHRRLDITKIDLHVIDTPLLKLDDKLSRDSLTATIERIKPKVLLLDPLIRLHSSDENSSVEMAKLLGTVRDLQRAFDLAVILIHHTSKKSYHHPAQALRGSSELAAFGDSYVYLTQKRDHLWLTIEHRAARRGEPMKLELVSDPAGTDTHFRIVETRDHTPEPVPARDLTTRLLDLLRAASQSMTRTQLRAGLRVKNERLGRLLHALEISGQITRTPSGWVLTHNSSYPGQPPSL